ncbi:hypothetical protein ACERC8_01290 [Streptococcus sp. E29BA]|uniref:hypothetical protein n=1 Tax=Streptococcus sp. E29BA TaxID=3278716 RepID=UPI00359DCD4B
MTKQVKPLNLQDVTQPFDLATAIGYMRDNNEAIRGETGGQSYYFFLDVKRLPVLINGRRQFKTVETISGVYQWGGAVTSIPLADLLGESFTIMLFDEAGQPIWSAVEHTALLGDEGTESLEVKED